MPYRMPKKENWLRLIRNEQPAWIGDPWEAARSNIAGSIFLLDPITRALTGRPEQMKPCLESAGDETVEPRVKDISFWREYLRSPPLDNYDWTDALAFMENLDRHEYVAISHIPCGLFDLAYRYLGVQGIREAILKDPQSLSQLVEALADWQILCITQIIDHLHPDILCYHDNWGTRTALYFPPEVWRRFMKPHQKRIIDAVKGRGVIFMHQTDQYCEPLVKDMVQIGIDIWHGATPPNDIVKIQRFLRGRMAIIGGIDASLIDKPIADEAAIRAEVRRCIDTYCDLGFFVPCISSGQPQYKNVSSIYLDELKRYGADYARRHFHFGERRATSISVLENLKDL
jgi:hypothetical protein